jgi:Zn-dependent protease with chaperone function
MMHLTLLLTAVLVAIAWRSTWAPLTTSWSQRWQSTLNAFLLPPALLLSTAIALLCMGPKGQMVRWWEGWGSYGLAISFLMVALGLGIRLALAGWRSLWQVQQYEQVEIQGKLGRLLPTETPFIAQVGFWQPELVISQGLLNTLDAAHLEAVLVHEEAHLDQRDTFWFFWLGWLRRLTAWLPNTGALWQELLILRELRADQQAAEQVDGLLLAEALLTVVSTPMMQPESLCAAFSAATMRDRLTERIDALLSGSDSYEPASPLAWTFLLLSLLPLFVIPFHS